VATVRAVVAGQAPRQVRLCSVCLSEGQVGGGVPRGLFDQFLAELLGGGGPAGGSQSPRPGGPPVPPVRQLDITQFFSGPMRQVLQHAAEAAARWGSTDIDLEHLLWATLGDDGVRRLLARVGTEVEALREHVEHAAQQDGPGAPRGHPGPVSVSPHAKYALLAAFEASRGMGDSYIGPEHLLWVLANDPNSPVGRLLMRGGLGPDAVSSGMLREPGTGGPPGGGGGGGGGGGRGGGRGGGAGVPSSTPTLDEHGRDLTALAREGRLDPVIGREQEIEQTIEVLSRRTKNNPVLVGDAGVGKTAIVEGIASCIAAGAVPDPLRGKRLVALDLAGMLAGTRYRGDFEERLKNVMNELTAEGSNVLLFIDEIHTIVGAGAAEGAMDAANMLKPALARGDLHVIGATTLDEYRKSIERDAALERRFQPITVAALGVEDTIQVLHGLKDRYEAFHRVRITDEAIEAAARLSDRYITDRFLPDKAIDLIDQASARLRLRTVGSQDTAALEARIGEMTREKDQAVGAEDYERASRLKQELAALEEQLEAARQGRERAPEVTAEDIAGVVARATGIPVAQLTEEERERLLHLEDRLHDRVVGQEEAVRVVAEAVRRSRAGLGDPDRPVGSFLFLGPTGVGKTELARALAEALFGDEDTMVRFDMSEFQERHTVSRLVGAPPGYVGYEEAGQLTERIRRRPYAVLLFDEFEKAHPDVFNILLQLLDDGQVTDAQGRRVSFANTVVIMTSNFGAERLVSRSGRVGFGGPDTSAQAFEAAREQLLGELRRSFRPELINRIDEIVVFAPLTPEQLLEITGMMLDDLRSRMRARGVEVRFSDEAVRLVADLGYDPEFGARPLRRTIQRLVENELASLLLRESVAEGDAVCVEVADGRLTFDVVRSGDGGGGEGGGGEGGGGEDKGGRGDGGDEGIGPEPEWQPPENLIVPTAGPAEPR
jgi:ATP-dependent Clp protease ATP-binding subunit ClpC